MTKEVKKSANKVNAALHTLGTKYHDGLPVNEIREILDTNGFNSSELEGIYTGREGRTNDAVGNEAYISFSWYRMPSGRYEVTAYIS